METKLYRFIAEKIKNLRQEYGKDGGLSQDELADKIKVTANTISRWENEKYKPNIEDLEKLALFFNIPISSFFPPEHQQVPEIASLLSATSDLKKDDIEALKEFAEYRRLRKMLKLAEEKK